MPSAKSGLRFKGIALMSVLFLIVLIVSASLSANAATTATNPGCANGQGGYRESYPGPVVEFNDGTAADSRIGGGARNLAYHNASAGFAVASWKVVDTLNGQPRTQTGSGDGVTAGINIDLLLVCTVSTAAPTTTSTTIAVTTTSTTALPPTTTSTTLPVTTTSTTAPPPTTTSTTLPVTTTSTTAPPPTVPPTTTSTTPTTLPPPVTGTLRVSPSSVAPGDLVSLVGDGYQPGSTVALTLQSASVGLGAVTADDSGTIRKDVKIPLVTTVGKHSIIATGGSPKGNRLTLTGDISVIGRDELPRTGSSFPFVLGLGLLASGILLVMKSRRMEKRPN